MMATIRVQADLKSRGSLDDDRHPMTATRTTATRTTDGSPARTGDPTLSIGEVARQSGMTTSAIRYYEERGLVAPLRRDNGRRRFALAAVRRLWLIDVCTTAGFSLDETKLLLADRGRRRAASRALAEQKLADLDGQIAQLQAAQEIISTGLRCTCRSLEDCSCEADLWYEANLPDTASCRVPDVVATR